MLNIYHDEQAIRAEAMAMADDMGVDPAFAAHLLNTFDPVRVIEELTALQKEIENEYLQK